MTRMWAKFWHDLSQKERLGILVNLPHLQNSSVLHNPNQGYLARWDELDKVTQKAIKRFVGT